MEKKSHLYWHKYVNERVCPYGLRVQQFPNCKIECESFKSKWEDALTTCSVNLLQILIDHYQQELTTVEQDLQSLLTTGTHLLNTNEYEVKKLELNNHLEKLNRDIITTKEKKLLRDRKAFLTKKAYKWYNPPAQRAGKPFSRKNSNSASQNVVVTNNAVVSDSSSSVSSNHSFQRRNYKKARRGS